MVNKFLNGSIWKEGLWFVVAVLAIYQVAVNWERLMVGLGGFFELIQPFIIGAVLAYFLSHPTRTIQNHFEKAKYPFVKSRARGFSVLTIFVVIILIFTGIVRWLVPIIQSNILSFAGQINNQQIMNFFNDLLNPEYEWLTRFPQLDSETLNETVNNILSQISVENLVSQLVTGTNQILGHALNTISTVFNGIISLIICLYVLLYTDSIVSLADRTARSFIRKKEMASLRSYVKKSNEIFINFVSAQFLDACILGTIATILLGIINVRYAVTLGVILGVANMIPYFGSIFATMLTSLITLFTGNPSQALIVLIALLILQQIDGNIIGPRITGQAIGLNPIVIIISISIGGAYFGILGMFVSVPVAAMLKMFYFDYLEYRELKRGIA
ncbi:MAG: AI-2E family transporter [Turicibacter sp.]|nr:AI-2E family transporter [Turicibacter sp.]